MQYEIKTIDDILNHANQIIEKVENDPMNFEMVIINSSLLSSKDHIPANCIGGSSATMKLLDLLTEAQRNCYERGIRGCGSHSHLRLMKEFTPNDTDIFILNCKKESRTKYHDMDVVHKTSKTIEEFLQHVDLPPSQVVYTMINQQAVFYTTYHCLYSLLTGKYFLPEYLETADVLRKDTHINFWKRVDKYQRRGFDYRSIETAIRLTWLDKQLYY